MAGFPEHPMASALSSSGYIISKLGFFTLSELVAMRISYCFIVYRNHKKLIWKKCIIKFGKLSLFFYSEQLGQRVF
jgi:hypothetical protein